MAADHDLEMEDMNLNMDRDMEGELEEEKEMREDGGREDPFKSKKVHRVVSKWMLPEKVRRTYLERANCLPPPVFIISVSLAEVCWAVGTRASTTGELQKDQGKGGRGFNHI